MITHSYCDLRYGIVHSVDYRRSDGRLIHDHFETIYYDVVWC